MNLAPAPLASVTAMTAAPASGVHLRRTDDNAAAIDALVELAGGRVGLPGVLGDLDRVGRAARAPGRAVRYGFTWDRADAATPRWWPQGISSSADASETGEVEGRQLLAVGWYAREIDGVGQGVRVTFVDLATLRYRHVLLVRATVDERGVRLAPLDVHAGGLLWHGPHLHVAGTGKGFSTCLLDDVVRVSPGLATGPGLETFGHRYVLPVRFDHRAGADEAVERLRYSFLSLDRTGADGPHLVAGEYGQAGQTRRLARYPLDPATGLPRVGPDGLAHPDWLDRRGVGSMQGAVAADGRWWTTSSRSQWVPGTLYVGRPGAWRAHRLALPMGPEDLTHWPDKGVLWSVSEHPHRRWVFTIDARR